MRPIPLTLLLLLAVACGRKASVPPGAADSTAPAPPEAEAGPWTIRVDGVGPIRFGMRLADARCAGGLAEVGMSEADVRGRYPVGLRVQPHKYDPKGRYLVLQGMQPADSARRLIFETDGRRVVRYRAGITPAVEYVEGCA
jgi:hypothetical protein